MDHSSTYEVRRMCRALKVSPSGYYAWKVRSPSKRAIFDRYLANRIQEIHRDSKENYGSIKTWQALKGMGIACGKNRIARLRRMHGIQAKRPRREKVLRQPRQRAKD